MTTHPEFQVHRLNEAGLAKAADVANVFDEALTKLEQLVPPGRQLAIVKTKLEEACFFAKKAIATDSMNQVPTFQAPTAPATPGPASFGAPAPAAREG